MHIGIPHRAEREHANNERVADVLQYLVNARNMRAFGLLDLKGISASLRKRIKEALSGDPLALRARKELAGGNDQVALRNFTACLEDGADLSDARFFGVFWGIAEIARRRGQATEALRFFRSAVDCYPGQARENHYLTVADAILEMRPGGDSDAAAFLLYGMEQLGIKLCEANAKTSALVKRYKILEGTRTNEARPRVLRDEMLRSGTEPVNALTERVVQWAKSQTEEAGADLKM
jgi:hypothetical protein